MSAVIEERLDLAHHVNELTIEFDDLRAILWSLQGNAMHKDLGWEETNDQLTDLGLRLAKEYSDHASEVEGIVSRATQAAVQPPAPKRKRTEKPKS